MLMLGLQQVQHMQVQQMWVQWVQLVQQVLQVQQQCPVVSPFSREALSVGQDSPALRGRSGPA